MSYIDPRAIRPYAVCCVESVAAMKASNSPVGIIVKTISYHAGYNTGSTDYVVVSRSTYDAIKGNNLGPTAQVNGGYLGVSYVDHLDDISGNVYLMLDSDEASVSNFGAIGDGIVSDNVPFAAMAAVMGRLYVKAGKYKLNTCYIDVPITFDTGAGLLSPVSNSITIRNRITASSKDQIFYGEGYIYFEINGQFGEDSKHSYAAWWGIFPVNDSPIIQTSLFIKALAAYTTFAREGIFELDIGSYRIDNTITIPRGVQIHGSNTRLTIIDLVGNNYTAFQSGGAAVWIVGLQFEQPNGSWSYFDGIQILMTHDTPVIKDVRIWNAKIGLKLGEAAAAAIVENVIGNYVSEPIGGYPSDSALIWNQADRVSLSGNTIVGSPYGPKHVTLLGNGNVSAITNTTITDIRNTEKAIPLGIIADNGDILNTVVDNIAFFGDPTSDIEAIIKIKTTNSASVIGVDASGIVTNSKAASVVRIEQGSTGSTQIITVGGVSATSAATKALELIRTNGLLTRVRLGDDFEASQHPTPVTISGTVSRISYPGHLLPDLTMTNNSVVIINPLTLGGIIDFLSLGDSAIFPNVNIGGRFGFDVGSSPQLVKYDGGPNIVALAANTVPTGTTGSPGNLSISAVYDGTGVNKLYVENNTGSTLVLRYRYGIQS